MSEQINTTPEDALGRSGLLDGLTGLITNDALMKKGVIAIDGAWGVGKTWFGDKLKDRLSQQEKLGTAWINVFDADWVDDPALSLFVSIASQLKEEGETEKFLEKIQPYILNILPIAAKVGFSIVANHIGMNADEMDSLAQSGVKTSEKILADHINKLKSKTHDLQEIKKILTNAVAKTPRGKLVIFVDELDRCSPKFAVRFLERLIHLFNVEGLVFVLLWNRVQIQAAVDTFYGKSPHGDMYLDKFVDYAFQLPNHSIFSENHFPINSVRKLTADLLLNTQNLDNERIFEYVGSIAAVWELTSREIKHVVSWYLISKRENYGILNLWLLAIKVKHPTVFNELRQEKSSAHQFIIDQLKSYESRITVETTGEQNWVTDALIELHERVLSKNFNYSDLLVLHINHRNLDSFQFNKALKDLENAYV